MSTPKFPREVRVLLLDAGNTLVFLDFEALAQVCESAGQSVAANALAGAEIIAKRRYENILASGTATHEEGWYLYMETLLESAGVHEKRAKELLAPIRRAHDELNLWRRVPAGLAEALSRARAAGVRLGVISNSEGGIETLLKHVGLAPHFEVILDSHYERVAKPDPEIFHRALRRLRVEPKHAMYAGDVPKVDVDGARSAGMTGVLVDGANHFRERTDMLRVASVEQLVDELLAVSL